MKLKNINREKFNDILASTNNIVGKNDPERFIRWTIGAIIDACANDKYVIALGGYVYTVENDSRSGDLWDVLNDIPKDGIDGWIAIVQHSLN